MAEPVVYGPNYSTYVRTVRLALAEKGVDHQLHEVDIFNGENQGQAHVQRHPWGKVPAFEHDGVKLYESQAIARYVDLAFDGPSLQPSDAFGQARMTQIAGVVDNYAYPTLIGTIVINRLVKPKLGDQPDEDAVAAALPDGRYVLAELAKLLGGGGFAVGDRLSLADLHLLPVLDYVAATPEAADLFADAKPLKALYDQLAARDSAKRTAPQL